MDFSKTVKEMHMLAERLPEKRFNRILAVIWGGLFVASLYALPELIAAVGSLIKAIAQI